MSWQEDWINIISNYLFANTELKDLMLIPSADRSDVIAFLKKYFIEAVATDEVVIDEKVRILVYELPGDDTENPNVRVQYLHFDIYVKNEYVYGARQNYLLRREKLIFEKLKEILMENGRLYGMKLICVGDYPLPPKCEGYVRYHTAFFYKKTY